MEDLRVIIDIWNWYIKWSVIGSEDWKSVIIAKDLFKTKWMRKWKILDVDEFSFSINNVIDWIIKKLWDNFIENIYVWISHPDMIIKRVSEQKRILWNKIEEWDVEHMYWLINDSSIEPNYEILKIMPVQWIIDENIKLKDPIWMEWKKLELLWDIFLIPKNFYNSLFEVFEKIQLEIKDIIPNILWASEVAIDFDSKDLWTLLIDIWANQTSFVIYEEWFPINYWIVPIWWEWITKDISLWLQIDINEAEKLKREKWIILFDEQKSNDDTIDIAFLSEIISARYEEIFQIINLKLIEFWKDWKLPWWIILIWWWSKIKNLEKFAKEFFKLSTNFWKDKIVNLWDISNNIQFVNLIWVYYWSIKHSVTKSKWLSLNFDFWIFKKISKFFKDLF